MHKNRVQRVHGQDDKYPDEPKTNEIILLFYQRILDEINQAHNRIFLVQSAKEKIAILLNFLKILSSCFLVLLIELYIVYFFETNV